MTSLAAASFPEIQACRDRAVLKAPTSVEEAAQHFTQALVADFSSLVLARMFVVVPYRRLPERERAYLAEDPRLRPDTPILSLLGTAGRETEWNDRTRSKGHRAIALLDRETVHAAPMIARLLADLNVDLADVGRDQTVPTRTIEGSKNAIFYVPDARTTRDELDRPIIGRAFVEKYGVTSVFGMGGPYLDGTLAIAILFCDEAVDRNTANRYASFIGAFKIATMSLLKGDKVWRA